MITRILIEDTYLDKTSFRRAGHSRAGADSTQSGPTRSRFSTPERQLGVNGNRVDDRLVTASSWTMAQGGAAAEELHMGPEGRSQGWGGSKNTRKIRNSFPERFRDRARARSATAPASRPSRPGSSTPILIHRATTNIIKHFFAVTY